MFDLLFTFPFNEILVTCFTGKLVAAINKLLYVCSFYYYFIKYLGISSLKKCMYICMRSHLNFVAFYRTRNKESVPAKLDKGLFHKHPNVASSV